MTTPPKINVLEPQNEGLEDDCPLQAGDFQVTCFINFQGLIIACFKTR